jgi:hypothetical protein
VAVSFSPINPSLLLVATSSSLAIYDVTSSDSSSSPAIELELPSFAGKGIWDACWGWDGQGVAAIGRDGVVAIWPDVRAEGGRSCKVGREPPIHGEKSVSLLTLDSIPLLIKRHPTLLTSTPSSNATSSPSKTSSSSQGSPNPGSARSSSSIPPLHPPSLQSRPFASTLRPRPSSPLSTTTAESLTSPGRETPA